GVAVVAGRWWSADADAAGARVVGRAGVAVATRVRVVGVRARSAGADVGRAWIAVVAIGGGCAPRYRHADVQLEVVAGGEVAPGRRRMGRGQVERTAADRVFGVEADRGIGGARLFDAGEERPGADGDRNRKRDRDGTGRRHRAVGRVLVEGHQAG